ncbi:MAG: hypothetical protein HWN65_06975 [Candidatus Helarchaeota archaeon]|nr:hypothetical protein [Candidatus Helarchaeota archaeon]
MSNEEHHPTKSWSLISSAMIGVTITILAIMWQFSPIGGMVTSTYLLMVALILFVNSTTVNEKVNYERAKGAPDEVIEKWMHFAEYSFGLAFTLYISTFAILGYKYLLNITVLVSVPRVWALVLPWVFLIVTWLIMGIYAALDSRNMLKDIKRMTWLILEIIALVLINLDYLGIITIP